jgi:hypothetical protein
MHSLSNELLSMKVIHLKSDAIVSKKQRKLMALPKSELQQVAIEVRAELNQPKITDVLMSNIVTKNELVSDILFTINNSVVNNFKTICSNGH